MARCLRCREQGCQKNQWFLYGTPRSSTRSLSPETKEQWIDYYNGANADLETWSNGPAKTVAAKGITHTSRLALVLHLWRKASGETDTNENSTVLPRRRT